MNENMTSMRRVCRLAGLAMLMVLACGVCAVLSTQATAFGPGRPWSKRTTDSCKSCDAIESGDVGGTWYWLRSPDEEKRVVMGLFNRYCIRCHGIDGRGVWDIPGVPDLTNNAWQDSRTEAQLARRIVEGRGAVMPAFRGTLSLDEAWAMARHLRSFRAGSEVSVPDFSTPKKSEVPAKVLPPNNSTQKKLEIPGK